MLLNCDALDQESTEAGNSTKIEVTDLFAEGIAIQSKDFGRFDLIATCPSERGSDQRRFQIVQHAVIEPDLGIRATKRAKEIGNRAFDRGVKTIPGDLRGRRRGAFPSIVSD